MLLLAAGAPAVKPGVLGSLIVAGLAVATFFLLRSMTKQLRKINFDERGDEGGDARSHERGDEGGDARSHERGDEGGDARGHERGEDSRRPR